MQSAAQSARSRNSKAMLVVCAAVGEGKGVQRQGWGLPAAWLMCTHVLAARRHLRQPEQLVQHGGVAAQQLVQLVEDQEHHRFPRSRPPAVPEAAAPALAAACVLHLLQSQRPPPAVQLRGRLLCAGTRAGLRACTRNKAENLPCLIS